MDTARRLTLCLAAGMDKNMIVSGYGETRLHIATNGLGDPREQEIFQLLLLHGAEVNVKDSYGFTPLRNILHCQVPQSSDCSVKSLRTLLEHGADVNAVEPYGYPPLFLPLGWAMHVVVGILLEHGADPNKADHQGQTPLSFALASIEYIIRPESVLFSTLVSPDRGETPRPTGAVEVLRFLLKRVALVEMRKKPWKEALILKGLLACVRLLVRAGALVERLETPERKELVEFICESSAGFWDKTR
jgi:ankyrin repeat protein